MPKYPLSTPSLETLCIRALIRVLETVGDSFNLEQVRSQCLRILPCYLRQHLVEELLKSGRIHNSNQLFVLEALLAPDVHRLAVRHVRRWYRSRFLQLLSSDCASGLQVLLLEDATWFTGTPVASAPLAETFHSLSSLRQVSLRFVCDDGLLASLGTCCPCLEEIDIGGSLAVSDRGVQYMCLKKLRHPYLSSSPVRKPPASNKKRGACATFVRTLRTIFLECFLDDALNRDTLWPNWWKANVIHRARKNPCCLSLRITNFSATKITKNGVELLRTCSPNVKIIFK